jgi:hypothetical protein
MQRFEALQEREGRKLGSSDSHALILIRRLAVLVENSDVAGREPGGSASCRRSKRPIGASGAGPRPIYLRDCYYTYFSNAGIAAAADFPVYQRERRLD